MGARGAKLRAAGSHTAGGPISQMGKSAAPVRGVPGVAASPGLGAQPSGRWLFASFPKVAADKSIYLGQIVSEKLPLELRRTKPAV